MTCRPVPLSLLWLFSIALYIGCAAQDPVPTSNSTKVPDPELEPAESTEPESATESGSWEAERDARKAAIRKHIADNEVAYKWFADFPFGTTDGIPYLILRSLPLIAPEEWGSEDNFLDVVGLFNDERNQGYPVARGVGWSGMGRDAGDRQPDYASFACGACHVGRVRTADGSISYLDGGINTEFNLVAYRVKVVNSIKKMIGDAAEDAEKVTRATTALLAAIKEAHRKDSNFFYADYKLGGLHFDADYEAEQIRLFEENAAALVGALLVRSELELSSLADLIGKNYKGFEQPMLHGFGGMADATGVSMSIGYAFAKMQDPATADPETGLPPSPGLTDFMAVWEQNKRKVRWNDDKTELTDGGGQWNGNIPLPMYRNMAAEMTMGYGARTDVRIAAFAQDLLEDLPAPPYPFSVDMQLAEQGKTLFEANCADCHRPHNGRVYSNLGTDLGRVYVVSPLTAENARKGFTAIGFPDRVLVLPPDGRKVTPFKEFEGVPLAGKPELSMRDPKDCEGYNALPLGGIWAQAPYLHNGSVPTLYHLLVPDERPDVFIKSRLDYDTVLVGFEWREDKESRANEGYRFDTTAFSAVSHKGHDTDIEEDGKLYKLNWSDDHDGAKAIIEYMKTF